MLDGEEGFRAATCAAFSLETGQKRGGYVFCAYRHEKTMVGRIKGAPGCVLSAFWVHFLRAISGDPPPEKGVGVFHFLARCEVNLTGRRPPAAIVRFCGLIIGNGGEDL
jgi:hypothetical protein